MDEIKVIRPQERRDGAGQKSRRFFPECARKMMIANISP
jgi:hypothetical protein